MMGKFFSLCLRKCLSNGVLSLSWHDLVDRRRFFLTFLSVIVFIGRPCFSSIAEQPNESSLKGIEIQGDQRRVIVEGYVCLTEGILEYLAVAAGGKEYESVLALRCKPSDLHLALIAIGGTPGDLASEFMADVESLPTGLRRTGRPGSRFNVLVRWTVNGEYRTVPATDFLLDRRSRRPPEAAEWILTGSYFVKDPESDKELYLADLDLSIVAVYYDPAALFNLPLVVGNPYRGDLEGFSLNTDAVPKKGTEVQVIFEHFKATENDSSVAPK